MRLYAGRGQRTRAATAFRSCSRAGKSAGRSSFVRCATGQRGSKGSQGGKDKRLKARNKASERWGSTESGAARATGTAGFPEVWRTMMGPKVHARVTLSSG
ncbi:protein of unknown function [Pararobbsia alpina]